MCKWDFPRPQVHRASAWAFGPGTSVAPSAADIEPPASCGKLAPLSHNLVMRAVIKTQRRQQVVLSRGRMGERGGLGL